MKYKIALLKARGLNESEAKEFLTLVNKIKPTDEDLESFKREILEPIPFEGGMGLTEALTAVTISLLPNKDDY